MGAVSPGAMAGGSLHLMSFSQDATLAQVTAHLESLGLPSTTAGSAAARIFNLSSSHAANAVLAAVAAGSGTVVVLQLLGPKIRKRTKLGIAVFVAMIAWFLYYFFASIPNPFEGKWVASPAEARYEYGTAPQSAICTMDAEGSRLTVTESEMPLRGAPQHRTYILDTDGKDHPVSPEAGASAAAATLTKRTLEAAFKQNGTVVRREKWDLSTDGKEMTVTVTGQAPSGATYTNLSVYEKK
jgi:hypothetical protein